MKSMLLDMSEVDALSIGIHVETATGSNLLDLLESVDGVNFIVVASLVITEPSDTIWHAYPVFSHWKKLLFTPGTGACTLTVTMNSRNNTIGSTGKTYNPKMGIS